MSILLAWARRLPARGIIVLVALVLTGPSLVAQSTPIPSTSDSASLRVEQSFSLAAVTWWADITRHGTRVRGVMWAETGEVNREFVRTAFGCQPRRTRDTARERWRCQVPFTRGEPAWAALLERLEAAGVAEPPAATDLSAIDSGSGPNRIVRMTLCQDGTPWIVTWQGASARTPVRTVEGCGTLSAARQAFEAQVSSVLGALVTAADPAPAGALRR